jgi:hypothetical protein
VFAIAVYATVCIPTLRTVVEPLAEVDTQEDRVLALRVLSAANVIVALCLGAILLLQVRPLARFLDIGSNNNTRTLSQ